MKYITRIIQEANRAVHGVDLFFVLLKTLVILMVSYLILFLIGLNGLYAFIPALAYFVSSFFVDLRIDGVKKIEKNYKGLNEKLRTARDNQDKDNIILDYLEKDIVTQLQSVRISKFFSVGKMLILLCLLIISVGASLYIAKEEMKVVDFDSVLAAAMKGLLQDENETTEEINFEGDQESILQVGDEEIEVEINAVGLDFDFDEVSEPEDYEFSTAFPKEAFISSGAAYESDFTEEQQMLIKRYFDTKKY